MQWVGGLKVDVAVSVQNTFLSNFSTMSYTEISYIFQLYIDHGQTQQSFFSCLSSSSVGSAAKACIYPCVASSRLILCLFCCLVNLFVATRISQSALLPYKDSASCTGHDSIWSYISQVFTGTGCKQTLLLVRST